MQLKALLLLLMTATAAQAAKIAILYATKGGLGDVGKYCAVHALQRQGVTVSVLAISLEAEEGTDLGVEVDVTDREAQQKFKEDFGRLPTVEKVDIASVDAQDKIEAALAGCSSVISCLGNRQGMARWCALGAEKVTAAMRARGVKRLVALSSMGIGDDFLPLSPIKAFWACLLATLLRSTRADLSAMEDTITSSGLDFLLARPMGIDPAERPRGSYALVCARGNGPRLPFTVSKEDVADMLLDEALRPTLHSCAVTVGRRVA